jgi:DNA-binding beta-propeller fold protein YncE
MNIIRTASHHILYRAIGLVLFIAFLVVASSRMRADTGTCGGQSITLPFTDVQGNPFFCAIAQAFFTGLTNGTSATTYSPSTDVTREQMAAFVSRTHDSALKRGNRRAALQQWWQPKTFFLLRSTHSLDGTPAKIASDGVELWIAINTGDKMARVRASDGVRLEPYIGVVNPHDVLIAAGYVFVTSLQGPSTSGRVYRIDPQKLPDESLATTLFALTGSNPTGITFDGNYFWTANNSGGLAGGSITRITHSGNGDSFSAGFIAPSDILWDGENLWVADFAADRVRRVDPLTGAVLQSIVVGNAPRELLFDGANLWVSNFFDDSVTVIRAVGALRGTVLQTLTGNGIDGPAGLAFDGERVLVTNLSGDSVSLFKAADLTPLGNVFNGTNTLPLAACSDGLNFWIVRQGLGDIARF